MSSNPYPPIGQFFLVGKTLKSHGTSGQIRLMLEDRYKEYVVPGVFIFFDLNGSKVPYLMTGVEDGTHFVISLEDVINKREADLLSGLDIWIPLDLIKPRHQRSPGNLKGKWDEYQIIDELTGNKFDILRVEEYPQQLMAVISFGKKESLVPLIDQLITAIDKQNRIIHMQIPAGLLDL